jgi:hypothetical protein
MNDAFAERVHSAAVAGWWTILIGSLFLVLQWLASCAIGSSGVPRPNLADYVMGTGTPRGATAAGGA